LDVFHVQPDIKLTRRLGANSTGIRPILITFARQDDASYVIDNARLLRDSRDDYIASSVFLNADLTRAEAQAAYEIRCRRRESRQHVIDRRSKTVFVNSQRDSRAAEPQTSTATSGQTGNSS
jgi:hypothetical protein